MGGMGNESVIGHLLFGYSITDLEIKRGGYDIGSIFWYWNWKYQENESFQQSWWCRCEELMTESHASFRR